MPLPLLAEAVNVAAIALPVEGNAEIIVAQIEAEN